MKYKCSDCGEVFEGKPEKCPKCGKQMVYKEAEVQVAEAEPVVEEVKPVPPSLILAYKILSLATFVVGIMFALFTLTGPLFTMYNPWGVHNYIQGFIQGLMGFSETYGGYGLSNLPLLLVTFGIMAALIAMIVQNIIATVQVSKTLTKKEEYSPYQAKGVVYSRKANPSNCVSLVITNLVFSNIIVYFPFLAIKFGDTLLFADFFIPMEIIYYHLASTYLVLYLAKTIIWKIIHHK